MPQFRPAGFSDDDSDSDEYGFYEKPARPTYNPVQQYSSRKKIEINLQDAIINGNLKEVEKIITCDLNNDVNTKLDSGWTSLMHACFHAQDKIVKMLLDKGADPNLHSDSVTPIMAICSNSNANNDTIYNIITHLIENKCILNIGDKYGQTPLMRSIGSGRVAVVEKLLDGGVNIEMRDQQGWTALFWAVHHNQPEILETLISRGARLTEVDKSGRTPMDIANSHEYQNIVCLLNKYLNVDDDDEDDKSAYLSNHLTSWHDYYPGLNKGEKLTYSCEIPHLLYGMNCERLVPLFQRIEMDLRTFLLLEEQDMIQLGIDMPFERQRLKMGLRSFHMKGWKLNSVSGLYVRKLDKYSVLDCLTTLGAHLQQVYILEATLQYTVREYNKIQNQFKFEPPDSPVLEKVKTAAKNINTNLDSIRREVRIMKSYLSKISKSNPQPADLIKEKSAQDIALNYITDAILVCSLGLLAYHTKTLVASLLKK